MIGLVVVAKGLLATVAAAVLLVGATGCGERREPLGPLEPYPVTVQGAGEAPTSLAGRPARPVALTPGAGGILRVLGNPSVGRPAQLALLPPRRLVRALRALRPDLVVASSAADPRALRRAVAATRAPLFVFPDATLLDVERGLTRLGLLVDGPVEARLLVHRLEAARARVAAAVRGRPVVRVFVDTGFLVSIPERSLLADLLRIAGGRVVGTGGVAPTTLAALRAADPDLVLATRESGTTLASLRAGPARVLRAVRLGRFALVDAAALQPSPDLPRTLLELARILHPDALR